MVHLSNKITNNLTESCKNFKEGITSKIKQVLRNYVHLQSSKMSEKEWGKEIGKMLTSSAKYFQNS